MNVSQVYGLELGMKTRVLSTRYSPPAEDVDIATPFGRGLVGGAQVVDTQLQCVASGITGRLVPPQEQGNVARFLSHSDADDFAWLLLGHAWE
jgi:hypothetical protein